MVALRKDGMMEQYSLSPRRRVVWTSGIAFVGLFLSDLLLTPGEPDLDASAQQTTAYYTSHHVGILATSLLHDLAGVCFLIFLGALLAELWRERRPVVLLVLAALSAAMAGAIAYVSYIAAGAAAYLAGHAGTPPIIAAFALVRTLASNVAVLPLAVFLAATSLLILQSRVVPRWIGWLGLVAAAANFLSLFGLYDATSPLGLVGFLGALLFAGWTLATSIALVARPVGRAPRAAGQPVQA